MTNTNQGKSFRFKKLFLALGGIGLTVLIINPRVAVSDKGIVAASCTTKHFYMPEISNDGLTMPAGVYSPESFVDTAMPRLMANYTQELAGNPFTGLGIALLGSLKPSLVSILDTALTDVCAGRNTDYITTLSSIGNQ